VTALLVSSCGWILVSAPRTAGLGCTRSSFWPYFDLLVAVGGTVALAKGGVIGAQPNTLAGPAFFAATGLWGRYKVHQCRSRWDHASPDEVAQYNAQVAAWNAQVAAQQEQARQQQAAYDQQVAAQQQAAYAQALAAQQEQPDPDPANGGEPNPGQPDPLPADPGQPAPWPPPGGSPPTVTIERHASTDELGKRCHAAPGWPSAAECQYGAVCYQDVCTVWCGQNNACPSGYTCAMTDEAPRTDLCRR
jgi:hypothetical protein